MGRGSRIVSTFERTDWYCHAMSCCWVLNRAEPWSIVGHGSARLSALLTHPLAFVRSTVPTPRGRRVQIGEGALPVRLRGNQIDFSPSAATSDPRGPRGLATTQKLYFCPRLRHVLSFVDTDREDAIPPGRWAAPQRTKRLTSLHPWRRTESQKSLRSFQ